MSRDFKETSARELTRAGETVLDLVDEGMSPNQAICKVARDMRLPATYLPHLVNGYNISATARHRSDPDHESLLEKLSSFEIARIEDVRAELYPDKVEPARVTHHKTAVDACWSRAPGARPNPAPQIKQAAGPGGPLPTSQGPALQMPGQKPMTGPIPKGPAPAGKPPKPVSPNFSPFTYAATDAASPLLGGTFLRGVDGAEAVERGMANPPKPVPKPSAFSPGQQGERFGQAAVDAVSPLLGGAGHGVELVDAVQRGLSNPPKPAPKPPRKPMSPTQENRAIQAGADAVHPLLGGALHGQELIERIQRGIANPPKPAPMKPGGSPPILGGAPAAQLGKLAIAARMVHEDYEAELYKMARYFQPGNRPLSFRAFEYAATTKYAEAGRLIAEAVYSIGNLGLMKTARAADGPVWDRVDPKAEPLLGLDRAIGLAQCLLDVGHLKSAIECRISEEHRQRVEPSVLRDEGLDAWEGEIEPEQEKVGSLFSGVLGGLAASSVAQDLKDTAGYKTTDDLVSKAKNELQSVPHMRQLQGLQTDFVMRDMMANDEVVSHQPSDAVTQAYNELIQTAPNAMLQPAVARAMMRKRLSAGTLDGVDIDQLLSIERQIAQQRQRPRQTPTGA